MALSSKTRVGTVRVVQFFQPSVVAAIPVPTAKHSMVEGQAIPVARRLDGNDATTCHAAVDPAVREVPGVETDELVEVRAEDPDPASAVVGLVAFALVGPALHDASRSVVPRMTPAAERSFLRTSPGIRSATSSCPLAENNAYL